MQPAPGRPGLHSGLDSFCFNTNSSLSTAGSILRRNQCLSMAVCFQILPYAAQAGHCAVPVQCSLRCSPALNSGRNPLLIEYKPTAVASTRERRPRLPPSGRRQLVLVRPNSPQVAKCCLWAGLSRRGSLQAGPPCMLRGVWIASEPP
jgi:hypothetical protein